MEVPGSWSGGVAVLDVEANRMLYCEWRIVLLTRLALMRVKSIMPRLLHTTQNETSEEYGSTFLILGAHVEMNALKSRA